MPWITRGLSRGVVTTRYPRRPDGYGDGFRAAMDLDPSGANPQRLDVAAQACPTGAIYFDKGKGRLDRGRCVLCGRCAQLVPEGFHFVPELETAGYTRGQLVVPSSEEDDKEVQQVRQALQSKVKAFRRSIYVRHVDAGSDGSEEWEIAALGNPIYDVQRLGIYFTASPRHADVLLVTGLGATGMAGPLLETFEGMPGPKVVIAAGVDAISGGLVGEGYAANGGVCNILPVDVVVPGSPPSPFSLLYALLLAVGLLTTAPGGESS